VDPYPDSADAGAAAHPFTALTQAVTDLVSAVLSYQDAQR
jgi:hypothetical protein